MFRAFPDLASFMVVIPLSEAEMKLRRRIRDRKPLYALYITILVAPARQTTVPPAQSLQPSASTDRPCTTKSNRSLRWPIPPTWQARLSALGAQAAGQCDQVDCYFSHPARDFAQTDEALRIRQVDGQSLVTYKGPKIDRETKTRHEIELALPAGATTAADFAGCSKRLVLPRWPRCASTAGHFISTWQGQSVEAALDEVAGLGHFVELEISASEETRRRGPRRAGQLWPPAWNWGRANAAAIWNCCSART